MSSRARSDRIRKGFYGLKSGGCEGGFYCQTIATLEFGRRGGRLFTARSWPSPKIVEKLK